MSSQDSGSANVNDGVMKESLLKRRRNAGAAESNPKAPRRKNSQMIEIADTPDGKEKEKEKAGVKNEESNRIPPKRQNRKSLAKAVAEEKEEEKTNAKPAFRKQNSVESIKAKAKAAEKGGKKGGNKRKSVAPPKASQENTANNVNNECQSIVFVDDSVSTLNTMSEINSMNSPMPPRPCVNCAELTKQLDDKEKKISDLQGKKKNLEQEIAFIKEKKQVLEARSERAERDVQCVNDINKKLKAWDKTRDGKIEELQAEIASLKEENRRLNLHAKRAPVPRNYMRVSAATPGSKLVTRPASAKLAQLSKKNPPIDNKKKSAASTAAAAAESKGKRSAAPKKSAMKKRGRAPAAAKAGEKDDTDDIGDVPKKGSNHKRARNNFASRMESSKLSRQSISSNETFIEPTNMTVHGGRRNSIPPPPAPAEEVTDAPKSELAQELMTKSNSTCWSDEIKFDVIKNHFNKFMQEKSHKYGKIPALGTAQDPPTQAIGSLFSFSKQLPHVLKILPKTTALHLWNRLKNECDEKAQEAAAKGKKRRKSIKAPSIMEQLRAVVGPLLLSVDILALQKMPAATVKETVDEVANRMPEVINILIALHDKGFHCFSEQHFRPLYRDLDRAMVSKMLGQHQECGEEEDREDAAGTPTEGEQSVASSRETPIPRPLQPLQGRGGGNTDGFFLFTPQQNQRSIDRYKEANYGSPTSYSPYSKGAGKVASPQNDRRQYPTRDSPVSSHYHRPQERRGVSGHGDGGASDDFSPAGTFYSARSRQTRRQPEIVPGACNDLSPSDLSPPANSQQSSRSRGFGGHNNSSSARGPRLSMSRSRGFNSTTQTQRSSRRSFGGQHSARGGAVSHNNSPTMSPPLSQQSYRSRGHASVKREVFESPPLSQHSYQSRGHTQLERREESSRMSPPLSQHSRPSRGHAQLERREESRMSPPLSQHSRPSRGHAQLERLESFCESPPRSQHSRLSRGHTQLERREESCMSPPRSSRLSLPISRRRSIALSTPPCPRSRSRSPNVLNGDEYDDHGEQGSDDREDSLFDD